MAEDQRPGTVYWIDHFAVPSNDLDRWIRFQINVLGATLDRINGLTTEARKRNQSIAAFCKTPYSMVDAFLQSDQVLPDSEPGSALPRFGFFIRPEDIGAHLRRLDEQRVPHTDPIRTSAEGDEGTAIRFCDPDGNQLEFWAPTHLPPGAMAGETPCKVGRISHAVYESRDINRTADFFDRFCALDPIANADLEKDTLALPLAGGGRIVFHSVEQLGSWTLARARGQGPHAALTVRDEDYFGNYRRMWATLPEGERPDRADAVDFPSLPARTVMHGSGGGRRWFQMFGRGDDFYDWDANAFHFIGSVGLEDSPAMTYQAHSMDWHVERVPKDANGRPIV
ncbi:MAG TPA: VOC family protein [Chloroflexota bacterium]|nr:VOC family protein [Chloroflexota bacterium]